MSTIEIRRKHNRPLKEAKAAVERIARHIADKFDVEYGWEGNRLDFARGGVDGHIAVSGKEIHVYASLGFFLMAIKGPIEREIHRYLDEEFG